MNLIYYPNKILNEKCSAVLTFDNQLKVLADTMINILYQEGGLGLAAPQIGIPIQLIVVDPTAGLQDDTLKILVNPKIIKQSNDFIASKEGCLSFPGLEVEIQRPDELWIEFQDLDGKPQKMVAKSFSATVLSHEIDHLNGITIIDKLKPLARKLVLKEYNKGSTLKKLISNYNRSHEQI